MWVRLGSFIIKYRLILLIITGSITGFMAYKASEIDITYDFLKVVPQEDPAMIYFKGFYKMFGEDANIMVVGIQDPKIFKLETFNKFYDLCYDIKKTDGVNDAISLPTVKMLTKDTINSKLDVRSIFTKKPTSQHELDSLLALANDQLFYKGLITNSNTNAALIAISIDAKQLNSNGRQKIVGDILNLSAKFKEETNIETHFAGLPYVRTIMVRDVQAEFKFFLVLSVLVTSLILFFFFRNLYAVFFTFLVIVVTVIWTMGTIVLLGYKITILTGMLPALIIVIGIPNCIYMYNKYHQEYRKHGNKIKAISRIVEKIGFLTFMTNMNTAVGFLVLYFTNIIIIKEFGMVAGLISAATFVISLVVIPTMLCYLPAPNDKQLKHLDLRFLRRVNNMLQYIVLRYRSVVYIITCLIIALSIVGIYRIQVISYMVDDLPKSSGVKTDLAFFEQHFKGVMPLEIVVDLGKKKAIRIPANLKKLNELETYLKSLNNVSPPLSVLNIIKGAKQAYYNGLPEFYEIPTKQEMITLSSFMKTNDKSEEKLMRSFVDSTGQYIRFTCKVADIGTDKMRQLVEKNIIPKTREIFPDTANQKVHITGTTLLFLKGNQYLIDDLSESLVWAFALISLMMAFIFTNPKIIMISLIPNIIPIILTAGIMGLFNIPLKPSTALIFGISFGISIDSTIHYLSKFKQELKHYRGDTMQAVVKSLEEEGVSMIYTSIVLFCGFLIFAFSDFGGTIALGILTSLTLFFAMFTNLIVLPALLLTFSKGEKINLYPIIKDKHEKLHTEDDDVEIDLMRLEIKKPRNDESREV
jgi:predicted RND superfamily exporter protein